MIKFGHNFKDSQFDPFVYLIDFFHKTLFYVFRCRMFIRNVINFSSALIMEVGDSSHTSTISYQTTHDVTRAVFLIGPVVKTKRPLLFSCFTLAGWGPWLRCYATNRKGAGSIPAGVSWIFHPIALWTLGSTQSLTEMSIRGISCG